MLRRFSTIIYSPYLNSFILTIFNKSDSELLKQHSDFAIIGEAYAIDGDGNKEWCWDQWRYLNPISHADMMRLVRQIIPSPRGRHNGKAKSIS